MIELDNRTSLHVNTPLFEKITQSLTDKEIELIITTDTEIQEINAAHRGINKATDVLSFPYEPMPMSPLGSIVISEEFVKNRAKMLGHSNDDEMALLFIHGVLHLLGYDHEIDNGEMQEKEAALIKEWQLPTSLIVRTEG